MPARTRPAAVAAPLAWPAFIATVATMLAGLLLHMRWLPVSLVAVLAGIVAFRVAWRWRSARRVPALLRLALVVVLSIVVWRTLGSLFGREAGSALLASMLAVKLLETESVRDARLVATVTCFIALSGFLFDQGVVQMAFAALVVVLVFALLHLLADQAPRGVATTAPLAPRLVRAMREATRYAVLAVPFAIVCFVLFPRFSAPLWGAPQDGFSARTGISDTMRPGGISSLALDDTPVMRVQFDGPLPPPAQRYWRGLVLWMFDGESWSRPGSMAGFPQGPDVRPLGPEVGYQVWLDPTDQRWLFMLDTPLAAPADTFLTADLQVRRAEPVTSVLNYRGRSALRAQVQPTLHPHQRRLGLTLGDLQNPRAHALAEQWRRETGGDPAAIAQRALEMFNRDFIYTFEPPLLSARDGVDDFLFNARAGFCEHYASAFTYLMRAADVPARVVIGFQGGVFNSRGNYLVVRRSDAHAWAEIWIENEGWTRVDPTSAIAPDRIAAETRAALDESDAWYRQGLLGALRERFDVAGLWWKQAVVQFNALRQRNLLDRWGVEPDRHPTRWTLLLVGGALATLALAAFLLGFGRKTREDALARAWHLLLKRLARAGITRETHEGPADFSMRVARERPALADDVAALSTRYIALRYAAREADDAAVAAFARAVAAFKPRRG